MDVSFLPAESFLSHRFGSLSSKVFVFTGFQAQSLGAALTSSGPTFGGFRLDPWTSRSSGTLFPGLPIQWVTREQA